MRQQGESGSGVGVVSAGGHGEDDKKGAPYGRGIGGGGGRHFG